MPQTKSAAKRLRQSEKRRLQNRSAKRNLRTLCRKVRESLQAGDAAKAETEFRLACKRFDQAGAKRVIHPNVASRTKSRLSALIRKFKSGDTLAVQQSTLGKSLG